jgi:ribulose 1,5-bisphosphate synthetase/thiazole synthase
MGWQKTGVAVAGAAAGVVSDGAALGPVLVFGGAALSGEENLMKEANELTGCFQPF